MSKRLGPLTIALCCLSSLTLSAGVSAAAEVVPEKLRGKTLALKKQDTHVSKLTLGATGSANSAANVVGAQDGSTIQVGVLLQGDSKLTRGQHVIETTGKIQHAQTRTPVMDSFIKSADVVELQSTWMYHFGNKAKVGPFARLKGATQMIGSVDIRPTAVTVEKTMLDGTVQTKQSDPEVATTTTGAFEPLILTETFGVFIDPLAEKALTLKLKAGAGAQQIIARNGFALTKYDKDKALVQLKQLDTSIQAGGEFELQANGELTKTVAWKAKANFFQPLYSTSEQKLEGLDALQTDFAAALSVKLAKWAKLDYVFNVKRQPLVLERWQVQHGLLLTTGFNLL